MGWRNEQTGTWQHQHNQCATYGDPDDALGAIHVAGAKIEPPVYWSGMQYDAATGLYEAGAQRYDPFTARYLSENPLGVVGDANPYRRAGNDPVNAAEREAFWDSLAGPNPDGRTWFDDYLIDPAAGFSTGYADVWTFGRASSWQRSIYGDAIADYNTSGYTYLAGLGVGIGTSIWAGGLASGSIAGYAGTGRAAMMITRAWAFTGDVVGVYDSVTALRSGTFTAFDTLGFLPTLGWAATGFRGASKLPGHLRKITGQLATEFGDYRLYAVPPSMRPAAAPVGSTAVKRAGLIRELGKTINDLDPGEQLALQALQRDGYDIDILLEASKQGIAGVRTPEFIVHGVGRVDVITPRVLTTTAISRRIEGKVRSGQAPSVAVVVPDTFTTADMARSAMRTRGKMVGGAPLPVDRIIFVRNGRTLDY